MQSSRSPPSTINSFQKSAILLTYTFVALPVFIEKTPEGPGRRIVTTSLQPLPALRS
jgi:hypothetical protein